MENQQEPQSKAKCKHCGRPLVAIGDKRTNGKAHKDWNTRVLHKKRYREIMSKQDWENFFALKTT